MGGKLAPNFNQIIPLLQYYPAQLDEEQSSDIDNEIAETALNAIENLILKCQNEARQSLKSLFALTGKCLVYDPNYTYHEEDGAGDEDMDEGNEDWGSDFYDDEQDDDDDTAWKVRKSSIKIIDAVIISCPV